MAPLKFEDNVREKLDGREINPSKDSWSRLADKLDQQEAGSKSKFWWYVAASVIGLILVSTVFFKNNAIDTAVDPVIVDTKIEEIEKEEKNDPSKFLKEPIKQDNKQTDVVVTKTKTEEPLQKHKQKKNRFVEKEVKKQQKINSSIQQEEAVVVADIIKEKEALDIVKKEGSYLIQDKVVNPDIIDSKVADVVAQVEALQLKNNQVTEQEIDALLRKAQRDITTQRIINSNTVSATALLQDVEMELDETFKEKVFEALLAGFEKVKTAVVDRDN